MRPLFGKAAEESAGRPSRAPRSLPGDLRAVGPIVSGAVYRAIDGGNEFQPFHVQRDAKTRTIVGVDLAFLERDELVQIRDLPVGVVVLEDDGLRIRCEGVDL